MTDNGETIWIYNHAVHFEDKDGGRGHIHFLTETTHEHVLMDQLRLYMEDKLLENEKIFNIVSLHSDRTLCYYDFKTRRIRPWNEDDCKVCEIIHICFKEFSFEQFAQREAILPDSRETAKRMVREIHEGVPFGKANIHIAMPDGSRRWLQFKYSGLLDGETPVAALISYKDVTDRQKRELAYRRHIQASIFNSDNCLLYIESDLTTDQIEK